MTAVGSIYALCDPETKRVRYVGQTRGRVRQRVQGHVTGSHRLRHRHRVAHWLAALPTEPAWRVLEHEVPAANLDECEAKWVRVMRNAGEDLLNGPGTRAVRLSA